MDKKNLSLSISIYQNQVDKDQAIQRIKALHKDDEKVSAAIAIDKDTNGKIQYKDIGMTPQKGAVSGLVLGAVVGVLTGGIGLVLGTAGSLIGGLIGSRKYQNRFSEVRLHEVVAGLKPGTSTIVAVVQQDSLSELEQQFAALNVEFFNAQLTDDLAEKLAQAKPGSADGDWSEQIEA